MLSLLIIGLFARGDVVLGLTLPPSGQLISTSGYILPQFDPNPSQRAQGVVINRAGFSNGPSLIGNSSFFPAGTLGDQRVKTDIAGFIQNAAFITQAIEDEKGAVEQKIKQV